MFRLLSFPMDERRSWIGDSVIMLQDIGWVLRN